MISRFTDKNKFGGHTWQIKNSSTVRVHIKGTARPCEYTIEIQEFGWVRWSTRESSLCNQPLPQTIREAFEKLYDFFEAHDDFDVPHSLMDKELNFVMEGLENSSFYQNEIAPAESNVVNERHRQDQKQNSHDQESRQKESMNESSEEQSVNKSDLVDIMEKRMTQGVTEQCQESDLSEKMMGVLVYSAIGQYAKSFKEQTMKDRKLYGLSPKEVEDIVDEASTRVLNKFLEL